MHQVEFSSTTKPFLHIINSAIENAEHANIADLILDYQKRKKRFYSIEVSPFGSCLNFNRFSLPPLFTSIVWLPIPDGLSKNIEYIEQLPAICVARLIKTTPTLLHLSCYEMTEDLLKAILKMDFKNILSVRGDKTSPTQPMKYSSHLVQCIKSNNHNVSVAVGAHPEGHPESQCCENDWKYLHEKISFGASYVITQICFSTTAILNFVSNCFQREISVPIILGVFIPFSFASLNGMCKLCQIRVPNADYEEYKLRSGNEHMFRQYAIQKAKDMILKVFEEDRNHCVVGVHFFSLNRFEMIEEIVEQMKGHVFQ